MFGKRERLYADARQNEKPAGEPEQPKAAEPEPLLPPPPPRPKPPVQPEVQQPVARSAMRNTTSSALELLGIATVSVGGFLIAPWLGCMILGVLLILLGVAIGYGA